MPRSAYLTVATVPVVDEAPDMISIGEAAKLLGYSIDTLRRWDEAQIGPTVIRSPSNQRRYSRAEVLAYAKGRPEHPRSVE